uniref:Methionyl-tRNA synthetase n=1 Tax=Kalanchoe fedtschenkoi TaxID=63787 RepID=A0A7N0TKN8_KALFE
MVFFCCLVDQTTETEGSKPAAGICGRCGGGASVADTKTSTRFCYLPVYWKSSKTILCTFCGSVLKSYR